MIVPRKHISFGESLLGLGGAILEYLGEAAHVDDLWSSFQKAFKLGEYPAYQSFDNFILALDLLYMLGLINLEANGRVCRATA